MENHQLKENILKKIHREKLVPRPRLYFVVKLVTLILLSLVILGITIFIFNFILFSLRINSHEELLGFGTRGIQAFLTFFPWSWLIIDLILIGFLQTLIRKFKFGYKIPVAYLLAGIFCLALIIGFAFDRGTDLNDRILRRAEAHRLPRSIEGIYGYARRPTPTKQGICRCTIVSIEGNKLIVEDLRFGTTTILSIILPQNDPRATTTMLEVGDLVMIAGETSEGEFRAFGVRRVGEGMRK